MKRGCGIFLAVLIAITSIPLLGFSFGSGYSVKFEAGESSNAHTDSVLLFSIPVEASDKFISIDFGSTGFIPQASVECFIDSWTGEERVSHTLRVTGTKIEGGFTADMQWASTIGVRVQVKNPAKAGRVSTVGLMVKTGASAAVAVGKQPATAHLDVTYAVVGSESVVLVGSSTKITYAVLEGDKLVKDKLQYRVLRAGRLVAYGSTVDGTFEVLTYYYTDRNKYSQEYVVEVFKESDANTKGSAKFTALYDLKLSGLDNVKYLDTRVVSGRLTDALGNGLPNVQVSIAKQTSGGFGGANVAAKATEPNGSFSMVVAFTDAANYVVKVGTAEYQQFAVKGLGLDVAVKPEILYASTAVNSITTSASVQGTPLQGDPSYRVVAPDGRVVVDWTGSDDPWGWSEVKESAPQTLQLGQGLIPGTYTLEARWDDTAKGNSTDIYDRTGSTTFTVKHASVSIVVENLLQDRVPIGDNKITVTVVNAHGMGLSSSPKGQDISRLRFSVEGSPLRTQYSFDSETHSFDSTSAGNKTVTVPLEVAQGGEITVKGTVSFADGREEGFVQEFSVEGVRLSISEILGQVGETVTLTAEASRLDGLPANNLKVTWKSASDLFLVLQADGTWSEPTKEVSIDGVSHGVINGLYTTRVKLLTADANVEVRAVYSMLQTRTAALYFAKILGSNEPYLELSPTEMVLSLPDQLLRVKAFDSNGLRIREVSQIVIEGAGVNLYITGAVDKGPGFEIPLSPKTTGSIMVTAVRYDGAGSIKGRVYVKSPDVYITATTALTDHFEQELLIESTFPAGTVLFARIKGVDSVVDVKDHAGKSVSTMTLTSGSAHALFVLPQASGRVGGSPRVSIEISHDRSNWIPVRELLVKPLNITTSPEYLTAYTETDVIVSVTDATGNPLPGRKVTIIGDEGVTDSNGRVVLRARPGNTGDYYARVETDVKEDGKPVYAEKLVRSVVDNIKPTLTVAAENIGSTNKVALVGVATDNLGISRVFINDQEVPFDKATGAFRLEVALKPGDNKYIVKAIDLTNNVTIEELTVVLPPPRWVIPLGKASPELGLDQPPIMRNGRTLLPFRWFGEVVLGAQVDYRQSGNTEVVTLVKDGTRVELVLNSATAIVDGRFMTLDTPATVVGGRTLVPARFLAELFGYAVSWQETGNVVVIEANRGI